MIIRPERDEDAAAIRGVVAAAFGQDLEADLVDALRASGEIEVSLIAVDAGTPVGHVLLSRMWAPARCLGLAPVAVRPDRQRQGIGAALIGDALGRAREAGWRGVFVLGEPAYYSRFGFALDAAAPFETGYPRSHFMALELTPGAFPGTGGPAIYAAPFGEAG